VSTIRRRKPRFEFVQILNAVARDYRVSWRARGLLTELLSYPENYETTVDELVKKAKRSGGNVEGRDAMRKAARELKDVGYIVETRYQNELGHWTTEQEITDDPMYDLMAGRQDVPAGQADAWFSGVGKPGVGKPGAIKKTEKKTEKNIPPPPPSSEHGSAVAKAGREEEDLSKKKTKTTEPGTAPGDTPPAPGITEETLERAQTLVDDAVRLWPQNHRAPSANDRHRLSARVAAELDKGGDETVIVHELSRDMQDAGSAIAVIMGDRTTVPGWGQVADPRPDHSQYEIRTKTPWCGTCDERTRQVVVRAEDGGTERMARCRTCHPEGAPVELFEDQGEEHTEEIDPTLMEQMRASLAERDAKNRERKNRELAATKSLLASIRSGAEREGDSRHRRHRRSDVVGGSRQPVPDHTHWANISPEELKNIL